ncbi:serine hydrolase domain-containing protein [Nonomuraea typhae]|uniref:serine hydrolase domain-containing protein n=1 Tax=Nonomuraea typhae TaxID=2603600 RepID=UPI0012FCDF04|nr:serine hydrolase domain-containing protein [Nonomuraea typhae]
MTDLQKNVQALADELVETGVERGLQVAVYRDGELVVDAVAGVADPATGRPMTSGTPVYVTSTGKGMVATVVHVLAERGVLAYDTPIAEYWPEFAAHGKERATVRHALTYQLGLPGVPVDTTAADLVDWEKMCATLAGAKPWWEPGTKIGYHPQSFMFIVGEVVRRASGKTVSQVLLEEVAQPLGVAGELFLAVPAAELPRLAVIEDPQGPPMEMPPEMLAQIPFFRVVDGFTAAPMQALPDAALSNRPDLLTSDAGATGTARGLARMYDGLLHGLIPAGRLAEATSAQAAGMDEVTGRPVTWGLGYSVGLTTALDKPSYFGMGGSGGTAAFADKESGLAVGITKNRIGAGDPFETVDRIGRLILG